MTNLIEKLKAEEGPVPFVCIHADPRCEDDPCPWGIARTLCNAPSDHPARLQASTRGEKQEEEK